jgi:hypothetical protein
MVVAAALSGLKRTPSTIHWNYRQKVNEYLPHFDSHSLRDHPFPSKAFVCVCKGYLTGLETLLLSENSKITELRSIGMVGACTHIGLTHVL